jgi:hypothetical protein
LCDRDTDCDRDHDRGDKRRRHRETTSRAPARRERKANRTVRLKAGSSVDTSRS